jgi:type IV pilus assembly protein PilY1
MTTRAFLLPKVRADHMKTTRKILMTLFFFAGLPTLALAAPDTYIGDTAIYAALTAESTASNRPHVLFLIDTSRSTLNTASGAAYKFDAANPYTGSRNTWTIYSADQQGNFSQVEVDGLNSDLTGITCSSTEGQAIKNALLTTGTYAGSGTSAFPNLNRGTCSTGPTGKVYALGNYLNYLAAPPPVDLDRTVQNTYDCQIDIKVGGKLQSTLVTDGCNGTFSFTGTSDLVTDTSTEPMKGVDWEKYWTLTSGGCVSGATNCSTTSSPALLTIDAKIPVWKSGTTFTPAPDGTVSGGTQRQIIYDALTQAIDGKRSTLNIGAMTYNPQNQGGRIAYNIADLSSDSAWKAFKASLPGSNPNYTGDLIASGPNRPQAEALFDAGYYLGAKYPTSGTIPSTALFPLNDSTFSRVNISTLMANKYQASNRSLCQNNIIILITNGLSNKDSDNALKPLVDADGDGRSDESTYGNGSHYLDDVAAFLHKQDPNLLIYTILAFQTEDPLVRNAATAGGGAFFNVYSAAGLRAALDDIFTGSILAQNTSFVAPVVPASSTNRTMSSNRVYLGLFKPQLKGPWFGNLKRYGVSSDLTLLDRYNVAATDADGDFIADKKSFWGDDRSRNEYIMSSKGLLTGENGAVTGDGGDVLAGGIGGTLKFDLEAGLLASPAKQAWETRTIYTWVSGSLPQTLSTNTAHRFSPTNTNITARTLDVTDAIEKDKLINFVAGADGYDADKDGNSTEIREWVLGDILHSKPLIFGYNKFTADEEGLCGKNKSMIFVGSNDGMFHAFRDCDGKEVWAFIPDNVLANLKYLPGNKHTYFLDAAPTAYFHDVDGDNIVDAADGDKVVLIFGQGRGGGRNTLDANGSRGAYYAMDVTDPFAPVLLWKIDSDTRGFSELGETWSPPRLAKVKVGPSIDDFERKVVAFVGAGYDNNEDLRFGNTMRFPDGTDATTDTTLPSIDVGNFTSSGSKNSFNPRGRGIYAIEIATLVQDSTDRNKFKPDFTTGGGSLVWSFVKGNDSGKGMDYSIPSDLTILDMNADGFQDRIYVGDTGGRLWSFDIGSTSTDAWSSSARMIFKANLAGEAKTGRKIFYKPTVAMVAGYPTLYFGTGDRSHPLNMDVTDRMFAVRDRGQTTEDNISINNLANLTENRLQASNATADEIKTILDNLAVNHGWYIDLNQNAGEKVLSSALVFNKQVFYTTFSPQSVESMEACQAGNLGTARLYQLDYATAEATYNYYGGNDSSSTYASNIRAKGGDNIAWQRQDRVKTLGVGIPSGIVTMIDASGKVTLMVSSSDRVGTYAAPDAKMILPLYWLKY